MYWNGKESLNKAIKAIEQNTPDNFNEILPVFKYGNEKLMNTVAEDIERAQAKGSKVIQKHSMRFNGKENVKWIDESYLLIGKAYFYKGEYTGARRTFDFVIQEFPDDDSKYEAMLWLAKTNIRNQQFEKAENILLEFSGLTETETIPYRYLQYFPLVFAEYYY